MIASALAALLVVATAPAGPPLRVRAEPATLRLGVEERARLTIEAPERPTVVASAGQVGELREVGAGLFEAEYVAPAESYPQVALVAALAAGRCGWAAVPLVGAGEAVVRTSPHARISVTIGDATFGPARADAQGVALVPVRVPPGVEHAVHRGQRIDLGVPPVAHVAAVVQPDRLPAGEAGVVVLHAFAVTPDGTPRAGAPLRLVVDTGTIESPVEVAPGEFEARWTFDPGAPGVATATASLDDERVVSEARVERVATLKPEDRWRAAVAAVGGVGLASGGLRGATAAVQLAGLTAAGPGQLGVAVEASGLVGSWRSRSAPVTRSLTVDGGLRLASAQVLLVGRAPLGRLVGTLSAGGGIAHQVAELAVEGQPRTSAAAWMATATAAAGAGLRVGPGLAVAELRLQHVADPGRGPVRGSLDLFSIGLGYALDLR